MAAPAPEVDNEGDNIAKYSNVYQSLSLLIGDHEQKKYTYSSYSRLKWLIRNTLHSYTKMLVVRLILECFVFLNSTSTKVTKCPGDLVN